MKRMIAALLAMVMVLCLTACNASNNNGTKEELDTLLHSVSRLPLATPGITDETLIIGVDFLDWCQATSMTNEEIKTAVQSYYKTLKTDDNRTTFYEQLTFMLDTCASVRDEAVRTERLSDVGINASDHKWEEKAFTLAASFAAMITPPAVDMSERTLIGEVVAMKTSFLLVKVSEGEQALLDAEKTMVSGAEYPDGIKEGDTVVVTYNGPAIAGEIAQVNTATSIKTASPSSLAVPVDSATFKATVLEVYESSLLVEPLDGEAERNCCDKISVSGTTLPDGVAVGDTVSITYGGEIAESYPAQIFDASSIVLVE